MNDWSNQFDVVQSLAEKRNKEKFADLYLLKEVVTEELFVLKTISKTPSNGKAVDRLRREVSFDFQHAGLPAIHSVHETPTDFSFIKKFQTGIDFLSFFQGKPKRERIEWIKKVSEGLYPIFQHLSELGITHCDLNPGNILLSEYKGKVQVELIDFGLAVRNKEKSNRPFHFNLSYSAPEVILNKSEVFNASSDIYSLGLILYRLFEGSAPFVHSNPLVSTNLALTYPIERSLKTPRNIWKIILKATSKHQFKTSPNRLKEEELIERLRKGCSNRYSNYFEFHKDIMELKKNRTWFKRLSPV